MTTSSDTGATPTDDLVRSADDPDGTEGNGPARRFGLMALETWVAASFGVAQPLLSLLGDNQTFFPAHDMDGSAVVVFALVLLFAVPVVVIAAEVVVGSLVGLVSGVVWRRSAPQRIRQGIGWVHLFVLGTLAAAAIAPTALRALDDHPVWWTAMAVVVVAAATAALARFAALRTFVRVLAFAPILFGVYFLFLSPASALVTGTTSQVGGPLTDGDTPPLVWMVLDEGTLPVIVGTDGRIDERRFPNFARLAEVSTWYPNATAGTVRTDLAVPAALSGTWPDWNQTPITSEYPRNLFTILGSDRYPVDARELITYLCPETICEDREIDDTLWPDTRAVYLRYLLPDSIADGFVPRIDRGWNDFGGDDVDKKKVFLADIRSWEEAKLFVDQGDSNKDGFSRLLEALDGPDVSGLHYTHLLLPHEPMRYLPDGRQFPLTYDIAPDSKGYWPDDEPTMRTRLQRVISQTMLADRMVGDLLDVLERSGNLERTALVVMGDHGGITRPGTVNRPKVNEDSMVDVTSNIVMIKAPGQTAGRVDERRIQQVDILPTVLESMGIDTAAIDAMGGPELDGLAATEANEREWARRRPTWLTKDGPVVMEDPPDYTDSPVTTWIDRVFAASTDPYRMAPDGDLVGTRVTIEDHPVDGATAQLDAPDIFVDVAPASGKIPAYVSGVIHGVDADTVDGDGPSSGAGPRLRVAVVVNGRIGGVGESFHHNGHRFALLVDPSMLVEGHNRIELLVRPVGGDRSDGVDPQQWRQLRVTNAR